MLKKASTVAAVATGLMLLGGPAFAVAGDPHEHDDHDSHVHSHYLEGEEGGVADQFGLVNFGNDSDLLSNLNVCETEVNVIAIPILSNNDESLCVATDNDDNDNNSAESH